VAVTTPTMRQRELGKRLRDLRAQHNLTVEDVGEKLLCSATKISRLETGARRPSLRDVRDLCNLYGVDTQTSAEFMSLARGAREQTWWTQYEDLNLDPYLDLEQDAIAITSYTTYFFPALLQTEEYTRAVIRAVAPKMKPDIYQNRVEARMRRQRVLEKDNPPRYRVLLDEAVLHRHIGGAAIMGVQLDKVLESVSQDRATVQVIPFNPGAPVAQDSNFILFELGEGSHPSVVAFVEGLTGNQYHERKDDIARYREAIESLRDAALSPRDSVEYMTRLKNKASETQ
jgi:transcriptional regulator with XRE-family HTH domain